MGNPRDIPTMVLNFRSAEAYLRGERDDFDKDWFASLGILEGVDTKDRVNAAIDDWVDDGKPSTTIFVCSGNKHRPDTMQVVADGLNIAVYCLLRGVPREQILYDNKASETSQNARYAVRLIDKYLTTHPQILSFAWVITYSGEQHLERFAITYWWLSFFRMFAIKKKKLLFRSRPAGPPLSVRDAQREKLLKVAHFFDPFGIWNPLTIVLVAVRRRNGRRAT